MTPEKPHEKVLYGIGYLGGALFAWGSYVVTKELLFLWNLNHRTARTLNRLRRRSA